MRKVAAEELRLELKRLLSSVQIVTNQARINTNLGTDKHSKTVEGVGIDLPLFEMGNALGIN